MCAFGKKLDVHAAGNGGIFAMNNRFTPRFMPLPCAMQAIIAANMKATIWHNPACGTSRKTLAILQETPGVTVDVVEYLKSPFTADKLRQLFTDAGMTAREALRLRGTDAEERGLAAADEGSIIAAMVANPAYVDRPFVETGKGVRYCRPQDLVREIL